MPRFINASVQTPNKLLRMVAEEICGQNSRKPADRYVLASVAEPHHFYAPPAKNFDPVSALQCSITNYLFFK
jgi:hypothetical protein